MVTYSPEELETLKLEENYQNILFSSHCSPDKSINLSSVNMSDMTYEKVSKFIIYGKILYLLSFSLEFIDGHFGQNMHFFQEELGIDDVFFHKYVITYIKIVMNHPEISPQKAKKCEDDLNKIWPYVEEKEQRDCYRLQLQIDVILQ